LEDSALEGCAEVLARAALRGAFAMAAALAVWRVFFSDAAGAPPLVETAFDVCGFPDFFADADLSLVFACFDEADLPPRGALEGRSDLRALDLPEERFD
jgi:hypothetical protein